MNQKSMSSSQKREKDEFSKSVGMLIRSERKKAGLTQEELADKSNFHRTYIGFIEQGVYSPNLFTLKKIVDALGVKLSDLLKKLD